MAVKKKGRGTQKVAKELFNCGHGEGSYQIFRGLIVNDDRVKALECLPQSLKFKPSC
jgi:hypothetical protein